MPEDKPDKSRFICGLDATLHVISGKWKPLILFFLNGGPKRYGELKRCVQRVSDKVLIQQLKELESDGIVLRTDYGEIPLRVDYSLTSFGASLVAAMEPLCGWGVENEGKIAAAMDRRKSDNG